MKISEALKATLKFVIFGPNIKKNVFTLVAAFLTLAILGYLVFSQWDLLYSYPWSIQPVALGFAFLVYSVILLLNTLTWTKIMQTLGSKVDWLTHFRSTCLSALGKRLPGTFWYVLWRVQIYKDDTSGKLVAFASAIEMAITVIGAILVCCVYALPLISRLQYSFIGFIIVFLVSITVVHPRVMRWFLKKLKVETVEIKYSKLVQWTALYIVIWHLVGLLLFAIGRIFSEIPLSHLGYFIGSVALTGVLSRLLLFSPSVFGFGEVSLSLLLSSILPSALAVIIAVSNRLIIIVFEITWSLISLGLNRFDKSQPK